MAIAQGKYYSGVLSSLISWKPGLLLNLEIDVYMNYSSSTGSEADEETLCLYLGLLSAIYSHKTAPPRLVNLTRSCILRAIQADLLSEILWRHVDGPLSNTFSLLTSSLSETRKEYSDHAVPDMAKHERLGNGRP